MMNARPVVIEKPAPMDRILIGTRRVVSEDGYLYLCADGSLTSAREQAQEFWGMQLPAVVAENWIVNPAVAIAV